MQVKLLLFDILSAFKCVFSVQLWEYKTNFPGVLNFLLLRRLSSIHTGRSQKKTKNQSRSEVLFWASAEVMLTGRVGGCSEPQKQKWHCSKGSSFRRFHTDSGFLTVLSGFTSSLLPPESLRPADCKLLSHWWFIVQSSSRMNRREVERKWQHYRSQTHSLLYEEYDQRRRRATDINYATVKY